MYNIDIIRRWSSCFKCENRVAAYNKRDRFFAPFRDYYEYNVFMVF